MTQLPQMTGVHESTVKQVRKDAPIITSARRRGASRNDPTITVRGVPTLHPDLQPVVLRLAGGDARRVEVVSHTEAIVR